MEELLKQINDKVDKIGTNVTELLVSDGRKHERIKSLENTRKWILGILGTVTAAVLIAALV